jgi:hypothetical protein
VSDLGLEQALSIWEPVYEQVASLASGLGEAEAMRPTRCAGWAVTDVLYHQLLDARRALRTFATPSPGPADRDYASYWREFRPEMDPGAEAAHARHVRIAASAYPPGWLAWEWRETAAPPPDPAALALTSRVLAGLLGTALPAAWDDASKTLKGTGREPLTGQDRDVLGDLAARFPLFG